MAYEKKPGTGAIFRNKSDNPKASTHKGYVVTFDGEEVKFACWVQEKKDGEKYFSVKQEKPRDDKPVPNKPAVEDFEDTVPF